MISVSFEPHVGRHLITGKEVDLNQDLIYADGEHVAFVGHQPGAPVNFIVPDPSVRLRQAVLAAVAERFDAPDAAPRKFSAPVEVEEFLDEEEE